MGVNSFGWGFWRWTVRKLSCYRMAESVLPKNTLYGLLRNSLFALFHYLYYPRTRYDKNGPAILTANCLTAPKLGMMGFNVGE